MTDNDPVELHRTTNLVQAHTLVAALLDASIVAHIDNEYLQGVVGEVAAGWSTLPRVLVARHALPAATVVLEQFLKTASQPLLTACPNCEAELDDPTRCVACGWTEAIAVDAPAPDEAAKPPATGVWADLGIVLTLVVVPKVLRDWFAVMHPTPTPPYWLDCTVDILKYACMAFVLLKWMQLRGESWKAVGIVRPGTADIGQTLFLLLLLQGGWFFVCGRANWVVYGWTDPNFLPVRTTIDSVLMVVVTLVVGFVEELAMRAYVITRLSKVIAPPLAALVSALLYTAMNFASGIATMTYLFMMGLILGFAFLRWKRLWPLTLAHALDWICMEVIASYAAQGAS